MTFQKGAFVNFLIFTIAFTEVASWTIDLPEVRKFLFEKNEIYKKYNKNEYEDYLNSGQKFYSNVEGNSKHNSDDHKHVYDKEKYADEYGYQSYMEKKVYNIVRDGSSYLEGLQQSLEDYSMFLEDCNRQNASRQNSTSNKSWTPQYEPSRSPFNTTSSSRPMLNFDNYDNSTVPMRPKNSSEVRRMSSNSSKRSFTCEEVSRTSEQVRRYADLAMWATKRLQDLAYAEKYQKTDEFEENELILKLAWFLDRLAYLSGYEPDHKPVKPSETTSTPTTSPTAPTLVPSSDEVTRELMECLRRNSSEPATVRCRYPLQIPDLMAQMMNSSGTTPSSKPDSDSVVPMNRQTDNIADQSSEILVTADNSPSYAPQKTISKRSTEYTYYFPPKPLHETTYPVPIVKLIKHRLSNIKSVVKSIIERRLAHIAEKKEEKEHYEKHFDKRSVDDNSSQTSNFIDQVSNLKNEKSIEKRPVVGVLHYPISDVSIINTKSFKKRSIDDRMATSNHINRYSNFKSIVKSVKKGPLFRKTFENFMPLKKAKVLSKTQISKVKSIKKRFSDDPFSKLSNYYIKYKVWENSNPLHAKKNFNKKAGVFDVKNHLTEPKTLHKRSLFSKKVVHMHIPKPLQIIHTYIRGNKHHDIQKPKFLTTLHKLHEIKHKKIDKIHKNLKKRSIHYEDLYLPRFSEDPQGDISYYIKNKEGTNYNPSLLQAGQVRLGLEQVFQTGNIEVIRRFGSNYNPLNPAPFYAGILATMADA